MSCAVNKVDSNATGFSFAEEECAKVLPTVAKWFGLEPNSYKDLGADYKTVARKPINATRKNKKSSIVGLTADGGFTADFTQSALTRLMQTFFFAAARQKPTTSPLNGSQVVLTSIATSDDSFNAAAGLTVFRPGHLVLAEGTASNDGLYVVATSATGKVTVTGNLTDETPDTVAALTAVGFQFGSGVVALTVGAAFATLTISGLVAATGTYTLSSTNQPATNDTVTIGTHVYTFKTALTSPAVANEVLIGANQTASLANLAAAINGTGTAGTQYGTGTVANTQVTAVVVGATVVVTAIVAGTSGNLIATTEVGTNSSWGAATLASGAGGVGWVELGLIPGEWLAIGGDSTATRFSLTTNLSGYARAHAVTDSVLTIKETTWTPAADPGTAKTIQVFVGNVLRDEDVVSLIQKRYVQFERTLGSDEAGPQAEYLTGAIGNELTFTIPEEDKITVELGFIASGYETRKGLEGLKSGTHYAAPGESAYNSTSDVYRIRIGLVDDTTLNPDDLIGFSSTGSIKISNGVTPDKAIGVKGGFDVSTSNFDVSGEIDAYFTNLDAPRSIAANALANLSMILAKENAGAVFDMPSMNLGGGRLKVEPDKAIKIPLTSAASESEYGHTLIHVSFPYLPTVLMPTVA